MRKQYNLAVPPVRGGMITMDASAVSSGLAFLESELEKVDPSLREPPDQHDLSARHYDRIRRWLGGSHLCPERVLRRDRRAG